MREIEFRAFCKSLNRMLSFEHLKEATKGMVDVANNEMQKRELKYNKLVPYGLFLPLEDDDLIFMQYTGLTDKNGTKIFEGDIVQSITEDTNEKRFAVIKFGKYRDDNFEDSAIGFYFECGGYQFSMFNGEAQGYDFPSFVEVIGNIHDNPELLEEV